MRRPPGPTPARRSPIRPLVPCLAHLAAAWFALPFACGAATVIDAVLAEVNGKVIVLSEARERIAQVENELTLAGASSEKIEEAKSGVLQDLIDEALVLQRAEGLGIGVSDTEVDRAIDRVMTENRIPGREQLEEALRTQGMTMESYRETLRRQIAFTRVRQADVDVPDVTEAEVAREYDRQRDSMAVPARYHVWHILLRVEEGSPVETWEQREAEATAIAARIAAGEAFEAVAREVSEDPGVASNGGDLGFLVEGDMMAALERVVKTLEPGGLSGPVNSHAGVHVVQLAEKEDAGFVPLEEVSDRLRRELQMRKMQKASESWLEKLRSKAYIKVMPKPDEIP